MQCYSKKIIVERQETNRGFFCESGWNVLQQTQERSSPFFTLQENASYKAKMLRGMCTQSCQLRLDNVNYGFIKEQEKNSQEMNGMFSQGTSKGRCQEEVYGD